MFEGLETDAWSKWGDELGFTGSSTRFLLTSKQSVSSCPEMFKTIKWTVKFRQFPALPSPLWAFTCWWVVANSDFTLEVSRKITAIQESRKLDRGGRTNICREEQRYASDSGDFWPAPSHVTTWRQMWELMLHSNVSKYCMKAQLELQFKMGSYRCLHRVAVRALYTQKPREGDRANKLKRMSRHPILERKGYIPANGFMHARTHTHMHMHAHTHTQLCCGVMGRNVSEPNLLQVAESQVCMCVRKRKGDVSWTKVMCASKYSLSFKMNLGDPDHTSDPEHIQGVFGMDSRRRRDGSEEMKEGWFLLLFHSENDEQ